jgi:HEAT repeat protein
MEVSSVILVEVPEDPATEQRQRSVGRPDPDSLSASIATTSGEPDAAARRTRTVVAGHSGDTATARAALLDPDEKVRAAAVGALERAGQITVSDIRRALGDTSAIVRRRACEAGITATGTGSRSSLVDGLIEATNDTDALVVVTACWALGERRVRRAVTALSDLAAGHDDPRCREAAVAALGAIGDPAGLPAVLGRLNDKPTIRRRAVVALSAFSGPDVDAAMETALVDRDWQVRQVAETLRDA